MEHSKVVGRIYKNISESSICQYIVYMCVWACVTTNIVQTAEYGGMQDFPQQYLYIAKKHRQVSLQQYPINGDNAYEIVRYML